MREFYNTTDLNEILLNREINNAKNQNQKVLAIFKQYPNKHFSPCDISKRLRDKYPLTSIRRSITNLTTAGKLTKTYKQKIGVYGKPTNTWILKTIGEEER